MRSHTVCSASDVGDVDVVNAFVLFHTGQHTAPFVYKRPDAQGWEEGVEPGGGGKVVWSRPPQRRWAMQFWRDLRECWFAKRELFICQHVKRKEEGRHRMQKFQDKLADCSSLPCCTQARQSSLLLLLPKPTILRGRESPLQFIRSTTTRPLASSLLARHLRFN